jgi:hypothetical protein
MTFQRPIYRCANAFGVLTQIAQVVANEGQLSLLRINSFNTANLFYRLWMRNIAAKAIDGIGWVNDNATILQAFYHLLY